MKLPVSKVEIEDLLPKECMEQETVDGFMHSLIKQDSHFKSLAESANAKNERLRYIASYKEGKGAIKLQSVDSAHPFYNLQGSDNMIVIHSKRYDTRPLVISGPGAGSEVTAAGVFAEIISMI